MNIGSKYFEKSDTGRNPKIRSRNNINVFLFSLKISIIKIIPINEVTKKK